MVGSGWESPAVLAMLRSATAILAQCGISPRGVSVHHVSGPQRLRYFTAETAEALVRARPYRKPAAYLVAETRRPVPFDAEAFAPANSAAIPLLADTVDRPKNAEPGHSPGARARARAHQSQHSSLPGNLMRDETAPGNIPSHCRPVPPHRADR